MTQLAPAGDGRYHCPHCDYDTQLTSRMAAHLRKRHGEIWTATAVLIAPDAEAVEAAVDTPPADEPEADKE